MVASSVDTAIWDALAIAADVPLATFLGVSPRQVPAYNSNGLGLMSPDAVGDEAEALLESGFRAVKLRLGRGEIGLDLAAVRAVRKRLPDQVRLMVDFNQALTVSDAMQYCLALDEEGSTGSRSPSGTTTIAIWHCSRRRQRRQSRSARTSPGWHRWPLRSKRRRRTM
jgi:mandelate racemase